MSTRSNDQRLPLWLRIVALGVEHAQPTTLGPAASFGHGELRRYLDPYDLGLPASSVTRAIAVGIDRGMLERGSNPRTLHLAPGPMTTERAGQ